jgi:hypothetical protein
MFSPCVWINVHARPMSRPSAALDAHVGGAIRCTATDSGQLLSLPVNSARKPARPPPPLAGWICCVSALPFGLQQGAPSKCPVVQGRGIDPSREFDDRHGPKVNDYDRQQQDTPDDLQHHPHVVL